MTVTTIMSVRSFNLVVPLSHEDTDMRTTDTASIPSGRSGAISPLSTGEAARRGDVDSSNDRGTVRTTPGFRTSTTATRTGTTRATTNWRARSADETLIGHADFSIEGVAQAYLDCRRTKRNTASALAFEENLERNLFALYAELADGTYRPGPSICFVSMRPKPREVWAAAFRDRVVHHYLYRLIGARFERAFIADSCACLPDRGTLYAAQRLEAKIRSQTQNWSRPGFYLKCDLSNFFVSIDKRVVRDAVAAKVTEPSWLRLVDTILFHDPRPSVTIQSPPALLAKIPEHKRLFNQVAHRGLPIGNLSSQFFANILLNRLDQFVKHELRVRHYVRYVDDFILLHESPQQLNAWLSEISAFLRRELRLELNTSKTVLQPIARGVDFVGHVIKPWRRSIRRRTFNEALRRCETIDAGDLFETANSYFGLLRQATHSHIDRAALANLLRHRGFSINRQFTKTYRKG